MSTYGNQKLSRKDYIKAVIEERVLPHVTEELAEHSRDMFDQTPSVSNLDNLNPEEQRDMVEEFTSQVEREMVDELIRQLQDYRKRM